MEQPRCILKRLRTQPWRVWKTYYVPEGPRTRKYIEIHDVTQRYGSNVSARDLTKEILAFIIFATNVPLTA